MSLQRDLKIAERRRDVSEMYLGGHTQAEIAHKWRVTQATISYDLKHIQAAWLESSLMDFDKLKARELARIDRLEREYWRGWGRSQEDAETSKERQDGDSVSTEHIRRGQAGDPRFLQGIQWCIEQRLKVFGVYAAQKIDLSWREHAEREGIDAGAAFEALVQYYAAANTGTDARRGESGGTAESSPA